MDKLNDFFEFELVELKKTKRFTNYWVYFKLKLFWLRVRFEARSSFYGTSWMAVNIWRQHLAFHMWQISMQKFYWIVQKKNEVVENLLDSTNKKWL